LVHLFPALAKWFSNFGRCSTERSCCHGSAPSPPLPFPSFPTVFIWKQFIQIQLLLSCLIFFQWLSIKQNQYIIYRICISLARLHIRLPVLLHGTYSARCLTLFLVSYIMRLIVMAVAFLLQGMCCSCSRKLLHFIA